MRQRNRARRGPGRRRSSSGSSSPSPPPPPSADVASGAPAAASAAAAAGHRGPAGGLAPEYQDAALPRLPPAPARISARPTPGLRPPAECRGSAAAAAAETPSVRVEPRGPAARRRESRRGALPNRGGAVAALGERGGRGGSRRRRRRHPSLFRPVRADAALRPGFPALAGRGGAGTKIDTRRGNRSEEG